MSRPQFASQPRRRRSPIPTILLLVLALFIGLLLYLGLRSHEVPTRQIVEDVTNDVAH